MANSARIDELKKKFDENPRRYFAPLANEYRKAGDPDQAIAICREFLPQQPGHMSGHIVYGQALFDAQQFEEARAVFDTALTLDPENLIALRHLGDIARTLGETATARSWYQRVLEADPRNDEIAAILTTLADAGAGAAPVAPGAPAAETGPSGTVVIEALKIEGFEPAEAAPSAGEPEAPAAEALAVTEVIPAVTAAAAQAEPEPAAEPPHATAPLDEELFDLDDLHVEPERPIVPRISTPRASLHSMGLEIERGDDDSFAPGGADESVVAEAAPPLPEEDSAVVAESGEEFTLDDFDLPPEPVAEAPAAGDPFATETMAELYLSQGHDGEALRVYRLLLEAKPGDAGLEAKVAGLAAKTAAAAEPAAEPQTLPDLDTSGFDLGEPAAVASSAAPESAPMEQEAPAEQQSFEPQSESIAEPDVLPMPEMELAPAPEPEPEPNPVFTPPVAAFAAEPDAPPAADAGPSIREFLAGIAGRAPTGDSTPGESTAVIESEVNVAVEDPAYTAAIEPTPPPAQRAAAEAPPSTPATEILPARPAAESKSSISTGGSIDGLFGGAGVSQDDQYAAATLAGAFGAGDGGASDGDARVGTPSTSITGAPARRATEELSLDSVFREPPAGGDAAPPGFSFDRFFANGTPAQGSPSAPTPPQGQPPETPDEDIQQFNSWLDGLKKR